MVTSRIDIKQYRQGNHDEGVTLGRLTGNDAPEINFSDTKGANINHDCRDENGL